MWDNDDERAEEYNLLLPTDLQMLLEVRAVPNGGVGVFALKSILPGAVIMRFYGREVVDPLYGSAYAFRVDPDRAIEAEIPYALVNHSCDPSLLLEIDADNRELRFRTRTFIKPGDELTFHYWYEWAQGAEAPYECHCGSWKCMGKILNPDSAERWLKALETDANRAAKTKPPGWVKTQKRA